MSTNAQDNEQQNSARYKLLERLFGDGKRTKELEDFYNRVKQQPDTPEGFRAAIDSMLEPIPPVSNFPYTVAGGNYEENSEDEYNKTGEQFFQNYKYTESFATLEEAQAALDTANEYQFVEFTYTTTDDKIIDLLAIHEQIKNQEPATPVDLGVKNRIPQFHWLQTVEFLVLGRVVTITGDTEKTGFIAKLVDDRLEITGQIDSATLNTLRRTDNVKIAVMQLPNHIPMEVAYIDKKYEQFLAR